jgi:hypothetical protein
MDSFSKDGPASPNVWVVGSRRVEFHAVEASAFIGRWSEETSSIECLRPRRSRPKSQPASTAPTLSTIVCDVVIAVSALIMIFCIPGLVLYSTMSH